MRIRDTLAVLSHQIRIFACILYQLVETRNGEHTPT